MITALAGAAVATAATALVAASLLGIVLRRFGLVRPNFRGDPIPVGVGVALIPALLAGLAAWFLSSPSFLNGTLAFLRIPQTQLFLLLVIGMAALGFLDDAVGDRSASGFKGHFTALAKGKVTTGAIKFFGGGLLALVYVAGCALTMDGGFAGRSPVQLFLDAMLIGLWANLLNLFDLRPGRAIKVFTLVCVALAVDAFLSMNTGYYDTLLQQGEAMLVSPSALPVLAIWLAAAAALLFGDLRAKFMLGDSGSNVLGVAIGAALAGQLALVPQLALIAIIVGIHIYAEKRSITELIARNRALRFMDELGRG